MSRSAIRANKQQKKKLSAAQRKFNATIRKIEKEKSLLEEWQVMTADFQQKQSGIYLPLMTRYNQARAELVKRFDSFFMRKSFSGVQREKMSHIICEITGGLIPQGFDDLRDIYSRYSSLDFDTEFEQGKEQAEDMLRELFEAEFGVDIGDDFDMSRPEEMTERIMEQLNEKQQQDTKEKAGKKKTASQQRKEAKAQQEEENISQSIKSVYRELTRALHPDRETDESERGRKTELMQRVTRAYRDKDLLKLLELQLEVEQIDQSQIDGIADDRLRHFNKVLGRQLEEIRMEVRQVSMAFSQMARVDLMDQVPVSPQEIMERFESDTMVLEMDTLALEEELADLKTVKGIQQWLKNYHLPQEMPFDELFANISPDFFR